MSRTLPGSTGYSHRVELKYPRCQMAAIWNSSEEVTVRLTAPKWWGRSAAVERGSWVRLSLVVALALAGVTPALAQAAPAKRYVLKHGHCKVHYVKRREKVKRREHGKTRTITETFCIHLTPTAKPKTTAGTPTAEPSTRTVALHSHLDPSFVQSPSNPLSVTYAYSASATTTDLTDGATAAEPNLPEGFLDLYSDGLLACSMNVGGSVTGGECPVTYSSTGAHQVIVTYSSGSTSATETYAEQIEPYATATHLAYSYTATGASEWQLALSTNLTDAYGSVSFRDAPEECETPKGEVEEACSTSVSVGPNLPPECSTVLTDTQTGKQVAHGGPSLTKHLLLVNGETEVEWNPGDTNSFTVPASAVEAGAIIGEATCTSADGFATSSSAVVPLVLAR
jgi:hypothetical protein